MKHNPIFDFIEEGMPFRWIMHNMGFEFNFQLADDYDEKYEDDPELFLDNWTPDEIDGYTLVSKYDTEDGPYAFFVKPVTYFAKTLLDFGFTENVQEAVKKGDIPQVGDIAQ